MKKILIIWFFICSNILAQQVHYNNCFSIKEDINYYTDSLVILKESISLSDNTSIDSVIFFNPLTNTIELLNKTYRGVICYQTLPIRFQKSYVIRDKKSLDSLKPVVDQFYYNPIIEDQSDLFNSDGINKSGTISRGISFGNNQSVFVNSVLNLQLEGNLTDNVTINAVISDQNIPYQPEGNTQQIQEFDKVYIQIKSKQTSLAAGDIVLKSPESYFLKYFRNVQGGQITFNPNTKDSTKSSESVLGMTISKGKFHSMTFGYGEKDSLIEGVNGPYRLRGPNNERFIIILANSEKVYLDGQLLKRGWDFDYVIDYNTAEITFTNTTVITRFSRLRVDFEFSDRNYSRLISQIYHQQKTAKGKYYVSYYTEQDNPKAPLTISLNQNDINELASVGDNIDEAVISGADSVEFTTNKILYKKKLLNGVPFFEYDTNEDSAFWEVKFSDVGLNNGSYILQNTTSNGRIFLYVGNNLGNYEPVIVVPTPKKKEMLVVGTSYELFKDNELLFEGAVSNNDLNRFSTINSDDDKGYAYIVGYNFRKRIKKTKNTYLTSALIKYEFNDINFNAIDRFRTADFERYWSEDIQVISENNILSGEVSFEKNTLNKVNYQIQHRIKNEEFSGIAHQLILNKNIKNLEILNDAQSVNTIKSNEVSTWLNYNSEIRFVNKYVTPGVIFKSEKNLTKDSIGAILNSQMYYEEQNYYLKSADTLRKLNYQFTYAIRRDEEVYDATLAHNAKSETTKGEIGGQLNQNQYLKGTVIYRFQNNGIGPTPLENEENVLSKFDWNARFFNNHIRSDFQIQSATGRELKREYLYIPVPPGVGTHVWVDYNNDGKQDLNEFLEKKYDDPAGEYIKTFIPTDDYIKAYGSNFNWKLDINMPRKWRFKKNVIKKLIGKVSILSAWSTSKKITENNLLERFVPFINPDSDTSLISIQESVRNIIFFNRTSPKYGLEFSQLNNFSKQLLSQGFEQRIQEDYGVMNRYSLFKIVYLKLSYNFILKNNQSDFLMSRNYHINTNKYKSEIAFQPNNKIRISVSPTYQFKSSTQIDFNNYGEFYDWGAEFKWNHKVKKSISAQFNFIQIKSNLDETLINSPIGYELFEALLPGDNYTWNLQWLQKLSNGLQLTLNYEGRKSPSTPIVHIGRMQAALLF